MLLSHANQVDELIWIKEGNSGSRPFWGFPILGPAKCRKLQVESTFGSLQGGACHVKGSPFLLVMREPPDVLSNVGEEVMARRQEDRGNNFHALEVVNGFIFQRGVDHNL